MFDVVVAYSGACVMYLMCLLRISNPFSKVYCAASKVLAPEKANIT